MKPKEKGFLKDLLSSKKYPLDLLVVILLSLITLAVVGLSESAAESTFLVACSIIFGIPFIIFLPGYALVSALWPQKSIKEAESTEDEDSSSTKAEAGISDLERVALSFGLSIAIVALLGIGLDYTPWGISLAPVAICLFCLILVMVGIAWLGRSKLSTEERFGFNLGSFLKELDVPSSADKMMVIIIAIAIVIAAVLLFYIVTNHPRGQYSELYMLDENGTIENYPVNLTVNESASIIIVVICHEQQTTDYNIVVRLLSGTGSNRTLVEYPFSLADGKEWSQIFSFIVNESGNFKLEVDMFKNGETTPYLTIHKWIDVSD